MKNMDRQDIHIISRHSNWSEKRIDELLKTHIYSSPSSWREFLKLFFMSLGIGFLAAGLIFFFAYNWADLHKFVKIGLIEVLLLITMSVVLFSRLQRTFKNILLIGASILVGALLAVFGQIYQTGANAYDLFLGWTLLISLWVFVSNFAPLWLLFMGLVNTTLILYAQQVAHDWSTVFIFTLLFVLNTLFLIVALSLRENSTKIQPPGWFTHTVAFAAITFSTLGICFGIIDTEKDFFLPLLSIAPVFYALGIWYGIKFQHGFYIAIIAFSIIIIISTLLLNYSSDMLMFFLVGIFVIISVSLVIKLLINFQKEWKNNI